MKAHPLSGISVADVNAIHATGEDPTAGDFFVVMTLQMTKLMHAGSGHPAYMLREVAIL